MKRITCAIALATVLTAPAFAQSKPGQPGWIPTGIDVPGPTCLLWDERRQETIPVRCNDFRLFAQGFLQSNQLPGSIATNGSDSSMGGP